MWARKIVGSGSSISRAKLWIDFIDLDQLAIILARDFNRGSVLPSFIKSHVLIRDAIEAQRVLLLRAQSANLMLIIMFLLISQIIGDFMGLVNQIRDEIAYSILISFCQYLIFGY